MKEPVLALARSGLALSFLFLASCGALSYGAVQSSRDGSNSLVRESNLSEESEDTAEEEGGPYQPLTGRMDGVEYVINKDLAGNGLASEKKGKEFVELRSAFDAPAGAWRPRRDFNIPVVKNERVEKWVRTFTGPLRNNFTRWMRRAGYYAPTIESILREYHLPSDLLYLAMIESGFNLHAYSRARAAGPWQFIPSTGSLYGLKSSGVVDERRDLLKATRAAAEHLRDLYRLYDDWYLAFAAYNAGAGKINRAIRQAGSRNYWTLSAGKTRYLRPETKDYVPKILAAAIIVKNYRKYGFTSNIFEKPLEFEEVTVPDATDVEVIAQCSGASMDEIQFLNPSLVMGVTPPAQSYCVLVPAGSGEKFRENYAKVPREERARLVFHKVKRKETVAGIARHYGIAASKLAQANKLGTRSHLRAGTTLVIPRKKPLSNSFLAKKEEPAEPIASLVPVAGGKNRVDEALEKAPLPTQQIVSVAETEPSPVVISPQTYRVKRGDTLGKIAGRHGVTTATLRRLNKLSPKGMIRSGQTLILSEPSAPEPRAIRYMAEPAPTIAALTPPPPPPTRPSVAKTAKIPSTVAKGDLIIHRVRRGETLWKVSQKYRVTVSEIKNWNRLTGNALYVNQKLKIYGKQPTATAKRIAYNR